MIGEGGGGGREEGVGGTSLQPGCGGCNLPCSAFQTVGTSGMQRKPLLSHIDSALLRVILQLLQPVYVMWCLTVAGHALLLFSFLLLPFQNHSPRDEIYSAKNESEDEY